MVQHTRLDMTDLRRRMSGAVEVLKSEFAGLRTGRASASLLDPLTVEVYGTSMPINQVATVNVPEPRMLSVQVWDNNNTASVEKAIRNSELGLNPITEGNVLRIPIPELNEERRQELARVAAKYAEQARIAIRNVRRDAMDTLKHMEKDHEISEDEQRRMGDDVQESTNKHVQEVDDLLKSKEEEIMQV